MVDISIRGGNMGVLAKGLSMEEKSGGFLFVSSLLGVGRLDMRLGKLVGLKRGSRGGRNPFRAALK